MSQPVICPDVVGREDELSRLEDALLDAARGDSRFVVITGEAGIGKTRLASEVEARARRLGFTSMRGGCSEAELALPYLPLIEAIGNHIRLQDVDLLARRLGGVGMELARLFPQLASGEPPSGDGDAAQAKLRLFEAIVALLSLPAAEGGLLLVVEDIHWADASTRELLDYLTRRLRDLRAMVLVTYRSDELHRRHPLIPTIQGWRRSGAVDVIELKEMSEEQVAKMMLSIFNDVDITPDFRANMHRRSEGNPFVLEEILRDAIDRGDIFRTESHWEHRSLDEFGLPDSVKDAILLRLERLGDSDVAVLQTAAVLGFSFSYSMLAAVSSATETEVQGALDSAIRNQLVIQETGFTDHFRFRHALTQEAIYDDLVLPRRQDVHSRAADVLAADPTTNYVDLALHLLGAGRFTEAVPACLGAAENAEGTHAYGAAVDLYERALPHISDQRERAEVLCRMGRALNIDGHAARASTYLEDGITQLEVTGEPTLAAGFRLVLGRALWELSRPDDAAEQYEKALAVLNSVGPSPDLALAYMRVAGLHLFQLDVEPALEAARKALETAEAAGDEIHRIWALGFLALALLDTGDIDGGLAAIERSYHEASAHGLPQIAHNAAFNDLWARVHSMLPGIEDALQRLEDSSGWGEWGRTSILMCRMFAMRCRGDIHSWIDIAPRSVERAERLQNAKFIWRSTLLMVEGLLESGDVVAARHNLPGISTRVEVQDIVYDSSVRIRTHIATGEAELLREAARSILDAADRLWTYRPTLALGVEAFVHLGDLDEAERLIAVGRARPYPAGGAAMDQAEGRVGLANGELAAAAKAFRRAERGYIDAGYVLDGLRTSTLLGTVLAALGARDDAHILLSATAERAEELGARRIVAEVTEAGRAAGLDLEVPVPKPAVAGSVQTGERLVTVLFADVRGYTEMTARLAPDEIVEMVTSLQRWATREVDRHYGLIDKFAGDAVMATFNVSGDRVDHCLHAVETAIALRDRAALAAIPLGIGVAVGPAVVGRLAPNANISVIGETTNLAARLQQAAGSGEIVLNDEAHRRVRDWLEARGIVADEQELSLKGLPIPVRAFRIPAPQRA